MCIHELNETILNGSIKKAIKDKLDTKLCTKKMDIHVNKI